LRSPSWNCDRLSQPYIFFSLTWGYKSRARTQYEQLNSLQHTNIPNDPFGRKPVLGLNFLNRRNHARDMSIIRLLNLNDSQGCRRQLSPLLLHNLPPGLTQQFTHRTSTFKTVANKQNDVEANDQYDMLIANDDYGPSVRVLQSESITSRLIRFHMLGTTVSRCGGESAIRFHSTRSQ